MKTQSTLEVLYKGLPISRVWDDDPDTSPVSKPDDASPPDAAQAERGVMHPDRHDLEWRYCRGGWAG
jgi:hypothetical protein